MRKSAAPSPTLSETQLIVLAVSAAHGGGHAGQRICEVVVRATSSNSLRACRRIDEVRAFAITQMRTPQPRLQENARAGGHSGHGFD